MYSKGTLQIQSADACTIISHNALDEGSITKLNTLMKSVKKLQICENDRQAEKEI